MSNNLHARQAFCAISVLIILSAFRGFCKGTSSAYLRHSHGPNGWQDDEHEFPSSMDKVCGEINQSSPASLPSKHSWKSMAIDLQIKPSKHKCQATKPLQPSPLNDLGNMKEITSPPVAWRSPWVNPHALGFLNTYLPSGTSSRPWSKQSSDLIASGSDSALHATKKLIKNESTI